MRCTTCDAPATHYESRIIGKLAAEVASVREYKREYKDRCGYSPTLDTLERHFGTETTDVDGYYCPDHKTGTPPDWYTLERTRKRLPSK